MKPWKDLPKNAREALVGAGYTEESYNDELRGDEVDNLSLSLAATQLVRTSEGLLSMAKLLEKLAATTL